MIAEEPTRQTIKRLRNAGWAPKRTDGSHTWWTCPTGKHGASVADGHKTTSPGVLRKVLKAMDACDCEGGK